MKKKIIIAVAVLLVLAAIISFPYVRYMKDSGDTEEFYRENVLAAGYANTVDKAIPQTEIYNLIKDHFQAELPEGKTEKKAIIIGYDGCRADILKEINPQNSAIATLSEEGNDLMLAYCGGVNFPEVNTQKTSTAPGWCSILTGKWADEHGITANDITKNLDHKTLLVSLTEEKDIDSAAFITRWAGHFDRENATYLEEKSYCEEKGLDVDFAKCKDDEASFAYTLEEIKSKDCSDFIFVIYEPTDSTGHNYGFTFNNPRYKKAFATADAYGNETLSAIRARETYEKEDWLVIVTSDHGGIGTKHGNESIQERMTFVIANKNFKKTSKK